MKIQPLGKRVLLQRATVEEQKTEGGVYIPQAQLEAGTYKAEVIAIGDEITKVKAGDLVLITQYSGDRAHDENAEEYLILDEDDLLATIDRA